MFHQCCKVHNNCWEDGTRVKRIKRWIYRWLKGRSGRTKKRGRAKKERHRVMRRRRRLMNDERWLWEIKLINWKRFLELTVVLNNCLEQYSLQVVVRIILIKDVKSFIRNIYIEYYWKLNFYDNEIFFKLNIKKDHYH